MEQEMQYANSHNSSRRHSKNQLPALRQSNQDVFNHHRDSFESALKQGYLSIHDYSKLQNHQRNGAIRSSSQQIYPAPETESMGNLVSHRSQKKPQQLMMLPKIARMSTDASEQRDNHAVTQREPQQQSNYAAKMIQKQHQRKILQKIRNEKLFGSKDSSQPQGGPAGPASNLQKAQYAHNNSIMKPTQIQRYAVQQPQSQSSKNRQLFSSASYQNHNLNQLSKQQSPSDHRYTYQMEQSSSMPSADISFIEAPPVPIKKKYLVDIRNYSNSTSMIQQTPFHDKIQLGGTKFRAATYHPEQAESEQIYKKQQSEAAEILQSNKIETNSEYYAIANNQNGRRLGDSQLRKKSYETLPSKAEYGINESSVQQSSSYNQLATSVRSLRGQDARIDKALGQMIHYTDPNVERLDSSSSQAFYDQKPPSHYEQMQQSVDLRSNKLSNMKSSNTSRQRRKLKTLSDSSVLNNNRLPMLQISPTAQSRLPEELKQYGQQSQVDNDQDRYKQMINGSSTQNNDVSHHITHQKSSQRSDAFFSKNKTAALFDTNNNESGIIGQYKQGSRYNQNQPEITMPDQSQISGPLNENLCMQIVVQAMSKCYDIEPHIGIQLTKDIKEQINMYRKQIDPQIKDGPQTQRIVLSENESSVFFSTISDRFYQKSELIIEKNCDLRPILSMILLGMQIYQFDQTKIDALKCIRFLADVNEGHFRNQIWNWIKYTSIDKQKIKTKQTEDDSFIKVNDDLNSTTKSQKQKSKQQDSFCMLGFVQTIDNLMNRKGNHELNILACRAIIQIAQKSLSELFLDQLPNLCNDRVQYLSMINEHYQMQTQAMSELVDEKERTTALHSFKEFGIPNLLVGQCLCLIEGNLIRMKQPQFQEFMQEQESNDQPSKSQKRIFDQHILAISLLTEIWTKMPVLFSSPHQKKILQNDVDQEDYGLKERLTRQATGTQKRRLLGSKVLSLCKKISNDSSLTVRMTIISRLFAVLEELVFEMNDFTGNIYSLLIFYLIEWHENKLIRSHLISNFTDLYKQEKTLSLHQLIEPLCKIIQLNLGKEQDGKNNDYLNMMDFSFFWEMANKRRITGPSAVSICEVMQIFMLQRHHQYRGVAEKIFFKLMSKFSNDDRLHTLLQQHANQAISELQNVDERLEMKGNQMKKADDMNTKFQNMLSPRIPLEQEHKQSEDDTLDLQLQLHYLYKHLLMMGRSNHKQKLTSNTADKEYSGTAYKEDFDALLSSQQYGFLRDHIINKIQQALNESPPERQSQHLISLLKKLLQNEHDEAQSPTQKELPKEDKKQHSSDGMSVLSQPKSDQSTKAKLNKLAKVQSHETLLQQQRYKNQKLDESDQKFGPNDDKVNENREKLKKSILEVPSGIIKQPTLSSIRKKSDETGTIFEIKRVDTETNTMTNSSDYVPTRHNQTIHSFQKVMIHVDEVERGIKPRTSTIPVYEEVDKESEQVEPQIEEHSLAFLDLDRTVNEPLRKKVEQTVEKPVAEQKEIGTDYDPPLPTVEDLVCETIIEEQIEKSSISNLQEPDKVKPKFEQGIQTTPKMVNKKMQVSVHETQESEQLNRSSIELGDNDDRMMKEVDTQTGRNKKTFQKPNKSGISEKDVNNKSSSDIKHGNKKNFTSNPQQSQAKDALVAEQDEEIPIAKIMKKIPSVIVQDTEEESSIIENEIFIPQSQQVNQQVKNQTMQEEEKKVFEDTYVKKDPEQEQNSLEEEEKLVQESPAIIAQTHRVIMEQKPDQTIEVPDKIQSKGKETEKIDLKEAFRELNTKIDNVSANLKSSIPGQVDQGTSLQTEIYKTDEEVKVPNPFTESQNQSPIYQKQRNPQPVQEFQEQWRYKNTEPDSIVEKVQMQSTPVKENPSPSLKNYQDKNSIVVDLVNQDKDLQIPSEIHSGDLDRLVADENLLGKSQQKKIHTKKNCPYKVMKESSRSGQFANQPNLVSTQAKKHMFQGLNDSSMTSRLDESVQHLQSNKKSPKLTYNTQVEPKTTKALAIRPLSKTEGLSSYKKAPAPRLQQYAGLPVSLPKMSDFWRGNSVVPTQYGDGINFQTQANNPSPQRSFQRLQSMPSNVDESLQEQLHLLEKQRKQIARKDSHKDSVHKPTSQSREYQEPVATKVVGTQHNTDNKDVQERTPISVVKETRLSWNSGQKNPENDRQLHQKSLGVIPTRDSQEEVKRLENTLQRLIDNLGQEDKNNDNIKSVTESVPQSPKAQEIIIAKPKPKTFDPNDPRLINLSPNQIERLKKLGESHDNDLPMSDAEKDELQNLLYLLDYGIPVDGRHPGMINLTPDQQKQLIKLYDADSLNNPPLSPDDKKQLNILKNLIVHGIPLNSKHPGVINLSPNQKKHLITIEIKQDRGQPLTPLEQENLEQYKNLIAHGQPVDSSHPGMINLTEHQKDKLRALEKQGSPDLLSPEDQIVDEKLKNAIVHGIPLNQAHPGMVNLSPVQKQDFISLDAKRQQPQVIPKDKDSLNGLQELLQDGIPIDEAHPGAQNNLTPLQMDQLKFLLDRLRAGDTLPSDNQKILDKLKNLVVQGMPLNMDHPGLNNITPRQQITLQQILQRRNKGQPLEPKNKKTLQNLQNLLINGKPLDQNHSGYKSLRPRDAQIFQRIRNDRNDEFALNPQDRDKFETLSATIQFHSGPFNMQHQGVPNLVPDPELETLKSTLNKQPSQLDSVQKAEFRNLKEIMRPEIPYDRLHPNHNSLSRVEKQKLETINEIKGDELDPTEKKDFEKIKDLLNDPIALDENHPGWDNLIPKEKLSFIDLQDQDFDGKMLNPQQESEYDKLKDIIRNGRPKDDKPAEQDTGLTPEERAQLLRYLAMRLFEQPMEPQQMDELNSLLNRDKDVVRDITPEEHIRAKELVGDLLHKDEFMTPEEQKELENLHQKQTNGIGGLNPIQLGMLNKIKAYQGISQPLTPQMQISFDFLMKLQAQPSQLNPDQEVDLKEIEERNRDSEISPMLNDRMKALQRMKFHPQVMDKEDRALFYEMKNLESLPKLNPNQNNMLFALQKKFNCLPYITPEQTSYMNGMNQQLDNGSYLSPEQQKDLDELQQLPQREPEVSDIDGLTAPECREYKKLKAKRDNGDQMSPEELQRYKELKDKIKKALENENQRLMSPASGMKSSLKSPAKLKDSNQKQVTYDPNSDAMSSIKLPSMLMSVQESLKLPLYGMTPNGRETFRHAQTTKMGSEDDGMSGFGSPTTMKTERKAAQVAFKKAMRKGKCTLKELINQFYIIEERYMVIEYRDGLKLNFQIAVEKGTSQFNHTLGVKPLSLQDFFRFTKSKKVRYKQHNVIEILRDESQHNNVTYTSFVKLLILASCGGDRTKIGISNFKKLMNHMDIFKGTYGLQQ